MPQTDWIQLAQALGGGTPRTAWGGYAAPPFDPRQIAPVRSTQAPVNAVDAAGSVGSIGGGAPGDSNANTGPRGSATGLGDLASQFAGAVIGEKTAANPAGFSVVPGFTNMVANVAKDMSMEKAIEAATKADEAGFAADQASRGDIGGMGPAGESGGVGTGGASGAPSGGGTGADPDGGAAYSIGGIVDQVSGANPPGPDDGSAALDRGEYVIRQDAVQQFGPELFDALNNGDIGRALEILEALAGEQEQAGPEGDDGDEPRQMDGGQRQQLASALG